MLHTMQPAAFIVRQHLESSCKCPECETPFLYGDGVMSLAHYLDENDEATQGLPLRAPRGEVSAQRLPRAKSKGTEGA